MLAGFGQPILDLYNSMKNKFEVSGVIPDFNRKAKFPAFYSYLSGESIPICSFDDINILKPDAIVVINYNRLIDVQKVSVPLLLNVHMGLLPVYRGNNANAWSILDGNRNVGYTLHDVTEVLDGGSIYYKYEYYIKDGETYLHAKDAINNDLKINLPSILQEVIKGNIKGIDQEHEEFIYASKLVPEDGILNHWNYNTKEILSRYIIFAKPLGTGLKFNYGLKLIEIGDIRAIPNFKKSKGIPGAVVLKNFDGSVWIKTRDTAISIGELIIGGEKIMPSNFFKIGERL